MVVVRGGEGEEAHDPEDMLKRLLESGEDRKSAIKQVDARCRLPRDEVYKKALKLRGGDE